MQHYRAEALTMYPLILGQHCQDLPTLQPISAHLQYGYVLILRGFFRPIWFRYAVAREAHKLAMAVTVEEATSSQSCLLLKANQAELIAMCDFLGKGMQGVFYIETAHLRILHPTRPYRYHSCKSSPQPQFRFHVRNKVRRPTSTD